ncbi:DUF7577 domain-containing protein [Euzebya tangerina]|uniref:DUF7577 domain-containing protein n=1 Tax=Euzebya tangerina TaxID=591198 RepID=UPI0013C32280|nr:zinc ribbon domain-containing protein [Euzebya tangerina]
MRCPSCGATNPDTATFCGQCYEVFATPEPDPAPPQLESIAPSMGSGVTEIGPPGVGEAAHPPARTARAGRFVTSDGQTMWTCAVCDTQNSLEHFVCDVCGAKMDTEDAGTTPTQADWAAAQRAEWMIPGLGHIRTGQEGMGYARLGVVALWAIGVVVLLVIGGGTGLIVSLPLLFGLVAVWGTGPGDVLATRSGREPRLDARRFMYVVIGVTAGLIVMGGVAAVL